MIGQRQLWPERLLEKEEEVAVEHRQELRPCPLEERRAVGPHLCQKRTIRLLSSPVCLLEACLS
jgi:hypothetical protein